MLRIHRIKTRLAADDKLVGMNLALWHDHGHRPILRSRHSSQRDWRVQIRKSADGGNAGQARVAIGVDEGDSVKIVRCFVILPIVVAVNNGKPPRFSDSRARISGRILPVIVAIVCVVAREIFRAVVQNVSIIASEEAIQHGARVYNVRKHGRRSQARSRVESVAAKQPSQLSQIETGAAMGSVPSNGQNLMIFVSSSASVSHSATSNSIAS